MLLFRNKCPLLLGPEQLLGGCRWNSRQLEIEIPYSWANLVLIISVQMTVHNCWLCVPTGYIGTVVGRLFIHSWHQLVHQLDEAIMTHGHRSKEILFAVFIFIFFVSNSFLVFYSLHHKYYHIFVYTFIYEHMIKFILSSSESLHSCHTPPILFTP